MSQRALVKISAIMLLCFCGLLPVLHYYANRPGQSAYDLENYERLTRELINLERERDKLESDYQDMRKKLDLLWENSLDQSDLAGQKIIADLNRCRKYAGLTDVTGPGLLVTLNDKADYNPLSDQIESLVHDENIKYLVDLLINCGAQAISVNNLRLVNSSTIYCVGTTIICNNQRMTPPYTIRAIGPQDKMLDALARDPLYTNLTAEPYSIRLEFKREDDIEIRAYETPATIEEDISLLNVVP